MNFSPLSKANPNPQVCLPQNILIPAQRNTISNLTLSKHSSFNINYAPRVRLTQNQLALAPQNSSQSTNANNTHIINTKISFHFYLQSNNPSLAAHTKNIIHSTLPNSPQIPNFTSRNNNQASLLYKKPQQFNELKHSDLSVKLKPHIFFLINNENSKFLYTSRAHLVNNKKLLLPILILQTSRTIIQ